MPEVVAIEVEANTDKAEANLNDVVDVLKDIKNELGENKKAIEKNAESTKELESNFKKVASSVKGFGLALKAAGIGLAIEAFNFLRDSIESNQKFADGLSKVFETLSSVVGVLLESLEPLVDIFGNLGSAIGALVRGDFSKLSDIGSDLIDNFKQLGNNVLDFGSNLATTVEEANKYADTVTKLRNETKLANAEAERQLFLFQTQAEEFRQQRDNFNLSFEERIAASKALAETLTEQYNIELGLRQRNLELAQLELSANKDNVDLQVAVIDAERELADLRERITGQRSEQLTSEIALLKERADAEGLNVEKLKSRLNAEVQTERTIAGEKMVINDSVFKNKEAYADAELGINQTLGNSMVALTNLAADGTKTQKAIALANIAFQQASAIASAVRNAQSPTPDNIATGGLAGIAKAAAIVSSILATIVQARNVIGKAPSVPKLSGGSVGLGGGGGSFGGGSFQPSTSTISAIPQFTNTTTGNAQTGVRAYVIQNDITNQQALAKRLDQRATL